MQPQISIIIAVKNGEKTIRKCLNSVFALDYQNFEVIIVNDGSTDGTKEVISSFKIRKYGNKEASLTVIDIPGLGPAEARNIGVKQAKGEYIALTDADCIVDARWLNELLKGFKIEHNQPWVPVQGAGIAGVGGAQLIPDDESKFGKTIGGFMKVIGFVTDYIKPKYADNLKNYMKKTDHNPTCNVMYKKEIFDKVGGFLSGMWPGEDVEFDYRVRKAGFALLYNPGAVVYHYRADNLEKFKKMMLSYGRVQGELVKKYGFFRKIQYVPLILVFALLIELLIAFLSIKIGIVFILSAVILTSMYFFARSRNLIIAYKYTVLMFWTVLLWNYGFLKGLGKPNV
ncbi:MAG: glycosyltransferase [Elusimicrobia bacterium]|nr:glycosyltransferase [Elusimicrobiota bacterium]MBU2615145.1 glycosyltransferase [Elusimicrobiota bacterium]